MSTELLGIKPSEVKFVKELQKSDYSTLFQVHIRDRDCVLKVYRTMPDFKVPNSDTNIFLLESKAYRRLKEKGLSARGVVPKFYGSIKRIQPQHWKPHLDMFLNDVLPPNAILIEHIPHLHQLDLSTYSKDRMDKLVSILRDIHKAGILHGDPYPRNMMVARGNPDRVLWIDFDRAQLLPATLTARQQELVDDENEMVDYFAKMIAIDHAEGKLNKASKYYYR